LAPTIACNSTFTYFLSNWHINLFLKIILG
jgi:hypothetical protein